MKFKQISTCVVGLSTLVSTFVFASVPSIPEFINHPAVDTDGNYTISWSSVGSGLRYVVQGESAGTLHNDTGTSLTRSGLAYGTYQYKVKACANKWSSSCSAYSDKITVEVKPPVDCSSGSLSGTPISYNGTINITWSQCSEASSYGVDLKTGSGSYQRVYTGSASKLHHTISGLSENTYTLRVKGCNSYSCDYISNTVTTRVDFPSLTVNFNTDRVGLKQNAVLSWSAANVDYCIRPEINQYVPLSGQSIESFDHVATETATIECYIDNTIVIRKNAELIVDGFRNGDFESPINTIENGSSYTSSMHFVDQLYAGNAIRMLENGNYHLEFSGEYDHGCDSWKCKRIEYTTPYNIDDPNHFGTLDMSQNEVRWIAFRFNLEQLWDNSHGNNFLIVQQFYQRDPFGSSDNNRKIGNFHFKPTDTKPELKFEYHPTNGSGDVISTLPDIDRSTWYSIVLKYKASDANNASGSIDYWYKKDQGQWSKAPISRNTSLITHPLSTASNGLLTGSEFKFGAYWGKHSSQQTDYEPNVNPVIKFDDLSASDQCSKLKPAFTSVCSIAQ